MNYDKIHLNYAKLCAERFFRENNTPSCILYYNFDGLSAQIKGKNVTAQASRQLLKFWCGSYAGKH